MLKVWAVWNGVGGWVDRHKGALQDHAVHSPQAYAVWEGGRGEEGDRMAWCGIIPLV